MIDQAGSAAGMQLGRLHLRSCVFQSPMANCTDLSFRLVGREYGMEMAYPEMISAEALVRETKQTLSMMKSVPEDRPLGLQLVGSDPARMAEAAHIVEDMGFDLVDVNIGCPVKKVTGKCAGSALLRAPELAEKIFEKMVQSVTRIPLTAKLRLGYSDASGREAIVLARMAEEAGFSAVAVHGRTRAQGYTGHADYAGIGRIKRAVRIPVIGNGDVVDGESAKLLLRMSGCDGVMVARGALGNPWIYREIASMLSGQECPPKPAIEDRRRALLKHFNLMVKWEGARSLLRMRKVAGWYFFGEAGVRTFREKINRAASLREMEDIITSFEPGDKDGSAQGALQSVA